MNKEKKITKKFKVIISGGGSGGHIFPAIAIANAIKEKHEDAQILFVGAEGKMEMEKVPAAGYEIVGLPIMGLQRRITWKNLKIPLKIIESILMAKKVIKLFNPDVVVGVGGYASGPLLKVSTKRGIPALIQEQNSYPGITNKWLAKKVQKICVAYEGMEKFFPKEKIILTGNPVRQDIKNLSDKRAKALQGFGFKENKTVVLIIGGSLGARTINKSIEGGLEVLAKNNIQLIWQTGKWYADKAKAAMDKINKSSSLEGGLGVTTPFISKMDDAYAAADVVISRAGALSISELCLVAKPVVLVPSPNVSADHQTKNAMILVKQEAALLVKDVEAKDTLIDTLITLINDKKLQQKLSENIFKLGHKNAASIIADEVIELINNED